MILKFHNVSFMILLLVVVNFHVSRCSGETKSVLAVLSFHNEEIVLPYFLSFFERIKYPKSKISLYIRSGNSFDRSNEIIRAWVAKNGHQYLSVDMDLEDSDWVMKNQEEMALIEARRYDFDYVWYVDPNGFITNPNILQSLMAEQLPIVAPMMSGVTKYYSTFWGKISDKFGYERSKDYIEIVRREKQGCFKAELLSSFYLIDMTRENSKYLTFNSTILIDYIGPKMPQMVLAVISRLCEMRQHICNEEEYGVLIPDVLRKDLLTKFEYLHETKLYLHARQISHEVSEEFLSYLYLPELDNLGFDKVYVINLPRHTTRRQIMKERLMYAGLNATFYEGVDGKLLNSSALTSIGYKPLEDCGQSKLSLRDIGWSLSHYNVWNDVIRSNHSKVIVLEDGVQLNNNFRFHLNQMLNETDDLLLDYDFIYLCRFIVNSAMEHLVYSSQFVINVENCNLACGYILTQEGARKLRQEHYISNMIPVDQYLVSKFASKASHQPEYAKRARFLPDLKAYSIHPLVAHPVQETDLEKSHQSEDLGNFFSKVGEANMAVASKY